MHAFRRRKLAVHLLNGQISPLPTRRPISDPMHQNMTVEPATSPPSPPLDDKNVLPSPKPFQKHTATDKQTTELSSSSSLPPFPLSKSIDCREAMGIPSITLNSSVAESSGKYYHTHKVFLLCNYILLGAASGCIFLTLSLRLLPSLCGFFIVLLHVFTIIGAISGCAAASSGTWRWYAAHTVTTVLTAIFQGSISVLIFTTTDNFLGSLKSYVREEDAAIILKLAGGLGAVIFCLEWVVMTLAFFLRYYSYMEGDGGARRTAKVQEENMKDWPWPFQV